MKPHNQITSKRTLRFYAPYISASGATRLKGFATRMSAARFLAKQALFDLVFGEKEGHFNQTSIDDGYWVYIRNVPDTKEERAKCFAKHFPLEDCPDNGCYYGWSGDPLERTCDCENYGYSRCNTREWMKEKVKEILKEDANG